MHRAWCSSLIPLQARSIHSPGFKGCAPLRAQSRVFPQEFPWPKGAALPNAIHPPPQQSTPNDPLVGMCSYRTHFSLSPFSLGRPFQPQSSPCGQVTSVATVFIFSPLPNAVPFCSLTGGRMNQLNAILQAQGMFLGPSSIRPLMPGVLLGRKLVTLELDHLSAVWK